MKRIFIIIVLLCLAITVSGQQRFYRSTTPMLFERQMYGATILGDYIYILGGNSPGRNYLTSVHKARINANGTLGLWEDTTPLPSGRSYIENSTLTLNDIVYIVGGYDGLKSSCPSSILWTRPQANGHLEPWKESPPYDGRGLHCSVAAATPGFIHLIAGLSAGHHPLNDVWSAKVGSDGSIIGWEKGNPFPTPLWYHCGGVAGGRVWIWGGLTTTDVKTVNPNIYYADILSSGKLGSWKIAPYRLPRGFYAASSTVSGSYLLSFCPRYAGRVVSNDIWYARVGPNGLSQWSRQSTDLGAKLFIGLATDYRRGFVYIPGGRLSYEDKRTITRDVYFFRLQQGGRGDTRTNAAETIAAGGRNAGTQNLSYLRQTRPTPGSVPGFSSYEQAREISTSQRKPLILYFHTARANRCKEQEQMISGFNPAKYGGKAIFAELDTMHYPQISQTYGVFRVPTWLFFDSMGNQMFSHEGLLSPADIDRFVNQIAR